MPAPDLADTPPAIAAERPPSGFDLSQLDAKPRPPDFRAVRERCARAQRPGEIVVCAPDPDAERLGDESGFNGYTAPENEGPPRLAWKLGDKVDMDVHAEAAAMPNGVVSKRVMVGAKIAF